MPLRDLRLLTHREMSSRETKSAVCTTLNPPYAHVRISMSTNERVGRRAHAVPRAKFADLAETRGDGSTPGKSDAGTTRLFLYWTR